MHASADRNQATLASSRENLVGNTTRLHQFRWISSTATAYAMATEGAAGSDGKPFTVQPGDVSSFAVSDAKAAMAANECDIDLDAEGKGDSRWSCCVGAAQLS